MITPVPGRIVWYHPDTHDTTLMATNGTQPLAATVVAVWSDTMINVQVLDANAVAWKRTSVALWQGEGEPPYGSRFCEWMPYQLGQAKRTTDLEAERQDLYYRV